MSFHVKAQEHWNKLTKALFTELKDSETASLSLAGERTTYLRLNGGKVRQNTFVEQQDATFSFHDNKRAIEFTFSLAGEWQIDFPRAQALLMRAREEVKLLPEDPFIVPKENKGSSQNHYAGHLLSPTEVLETIVQAAHSTDLAGLYAGGDLLRASSNSLGQDHWFSSESFFLDYSLYTKNSDGENKAVKGCYAGTHWNTEDLKKSLQSSQNKISLLQKKSVDVKPGSYRVYLAPGAIAEICGTLSWGAFSYLNLKQGQCALKALFEKQKSLSPLFSIRENFEMGFAPQFNTIGEMAPKQLPLISNGEMKNMIVSSRTAKEYGDESNGGGMSGWDFESLRATEVLGGTLPEADALKALGTGLYLDNLHYLNWSDQSEARITGMTRYACFWVENGEVVGPIKDLRFDETLYRVFGSELEAVTKEQHIDPEIMTYSARSIGGKRIPGMLIREFTFTL